MIRLSCILCFLCLAVCGVYGQDGRKPHWEVVKREPLSNGDVAVWVRDSVQEEVLVYFQKEYEGYEKMYRYRDTAQTDDRSVWLMYQSLCRPGLRDTQKKLGDLLLKCLVPMMPSDASVEGFEVQFMLDQEGKIRAMGAFSLSFDWLPSEVLLEVSRRMKEEIRYPSLRGKDYYPWGIIVILSPENLEKGYSFPYFHFAF